MFGNIFYRQFNIPPILVSPQFAESSIQRSLRGGATGGAGLFRLVKIKTPKHSQQAIYRSRVMINWERLRTVINDKSQNLPKCKKCNFYKLFISFIISF